MTKKTEKTLQKKGNRKILYINKTTMKEYELREITIEDGWVKHDKLICKDIPGIVYAKFFRSLVNEPFV